jgi:ElaB/YqjD/DUF883 family membrane-anchored ribosome-binding protein
MHLNTDTRIPIGNKITQGRVDALKEKIGDTLDRGKSDIAAAAHSAGDSLSRDIARLHDGIAAIRQTLSQFAAETAQDASSAAKSEISDAAGDIASAVKDRAKKLASKLESVARANPLGTIGAALLVGVFIAMVSRSGKT